MESEESPSCTCRPRPKTAERGWSLRLQGNPAGMVASLAWHHPIRTEHRDRLLLTFLSWSNIQLPLDPRISHAGRLTPPLPYRSKVPSFRLFFLLLSLPFLFLLSPLPLLIPHQIQHYQSRVFFFFYLRCIFLIMTDIIHLDFMVVLTDQ